MIANDIDKTWATGCVVLLLEAHAVELFLKGAILTRQPDISLNRHDIDQLTRIYFNILPEDKFEFRIPFRQDFSEYTQEEINLLKPRKDGDTPSVLYRYPVKSANHEWPGFIGMDPVMSMDSLNELSRDFERVSKELNIP